MKLASAAVTLISLASLASANAAWQKLSSTQNRPANVAVSAIQGTRLVSSKGIGQADSIVSDDPTAGATVSAGSGQAVIDVGKQRVLDVVSFVNEGGEGKATVSASTDNKNWTSLGHAVFTPADRHITISFAGMQAKYVRIQYDLSRGAVIRGFQIFGANSDKDFRVKQNSSGRGGLKLNFANAIGGSRVVYAHPTPARSGELGPDHNKFSFPESNEKYRTIIYDLGQVRMVSEFGSVHSPRPVRFEVFTFTQLPEREDWRGRLSFDPKAFEGMTPVAKAEDSRGVGYIKVKTDKPIQARYVALRWEPDFNPPPFDVYGTNVGGGGNDPPQETGAEGGESGEDGNGQTGTGGPPPGYYPPGNSPWGYGTAGYAGGGGSLPSDTGDDDQGSSNAGNSPVIINPPGPPAGVPPGSPPGQSNPPNPPPF